MTLKTLVLPILIASSALCPNLTVAATRQLECREWVDGEFRGVYSFAFESDSKRFAAKFQPETKYPLTGQKVKLWKVLYEKGLRVIVGGEAQGELALFLVFSLNFEDVQMFVYEIGGIAEVSTSLSKVERTCKRVD